MMNKDVAMPTANPCVRQCCLDDQDICLGCARSLQEILSWHSDDEEQKLHTLEKAQQRQFARKNQIISASPTSQSSILN
ncbi:DUF1289 domain-containing protein [Marinomonas transparens]|uniref:DUF1289 domain-containing protein n=1 Tax=Marinomonas transparens TaxID=2795388 RepID=A0A934N2P1_9GAMM|nr:DUF1289 domain-containing protein [Marinomonas transparens]MBJ7538073.1 DUF1289 domain-containing protein [Marinomonas transparens]